jgi:probable HAF family extracellular repeat protein
VKSPVARFALPAAALLTVVASGAHFEAAEDHEQTRYQVSDLPSLGGTASRGNSVNNAGLVAGYSKLAGDLSRHATVWAGGSIFNLGTLGGPNSSVAWPVKNTRGIIAGISQTATPDPLKETWSCGAFFSGPNNTGFTCLGFVWEDGVMRALPTLGGNNAFATGANNHRQVVGWAENTVHDPTCVSPQVLQFRPVVWGPERDQIQELPPLSGDTSGAATAINDRGQVVGISGTCDQAVGRFTAAHAVLWENDAATDIGNLGGNTWNTPMAINRRGDIVGFASQPGDDPDNPNLHAFIRTGRDGIHDLGTLPGDLTSQANGINNHRQVVGTSCPAAGPCRGFVWQDGVMTDLNALVQPGYSKHLESAQDINDLGEIAGRALDPGTNRLSAFLAREVRHDR